MSNKNNNSGPNKEVLVVDDSVSDMKILTEILKQEGFGVQSVINGGLALQHVQKRLPDLMLLDINMIGMNGVELCRRIKADPATMDIPVIFIGSPGEIGMKVEALEAGGADYISKPIETSELLARINIDINLYRLQQKLHNQSERMIAEIKECKRTEDALRRSEEKYRLLAKNSVDVVWQMEPRLKFTYVSPSVYTLFGYSDEEWVGTYLNQHSTRKEFLKLARQALIALRDYRTFNYVIFECRMLKKNRQEFPVEIIRRVLLNDKGLPIGLQGSTRDITKHKQVEDELAQYRENLEELEKSVPSSFRKKQKARRVQ